MLLLEFNAFVCHCHLNTAENKSTTKFNNFLGPMLQKLCLFRSTVSLYLYSLKLIILYRFFFLCTALCSWRWNFVVRLNHSGYFLRFSLVFIGTFESCLARPLWRLWALVLWTRVWSPALRGGLVPSPSHSPLALQSPVYRYVAFKEPHTRTHAKRERRRTARCMWERMQGNRRAYGHV